MSSRTAACGHPPVSMARIRSGERALLRVRNSASSLFLQNFLCQNGLVKEAGLMLGSATDRVKMSLVTAAMLYSSRRARQSASMRAVLPDPTGLSKLVRYKLSLEE